MTEWKENRQSTTEGEYVDPTWHERAVGFHVPERKILQVRAAFEGNICGLANGAVRSVASGKVPDTNRLVSPVCVLQRAGQTVRVLLERDELDASLDGDAVRLEVIGEHGFRVVLECPK